MGKRGRPPEGPYDKQLKVRLSSHENEKLMKMASKYGMTRSDVVRHLIADRDVPDDKKDAK